MKAISIKQPWASLIVHGIKNIENRTWKVPERYIGQRVLIHASGKPDEEPYILFNDAQTDAIDSCVMDVCASYHQLSAIIGSVEIVGCEINHHSIWAERGVYNWVLANPVLFDKPIPAKGKLSFWESDIELCHICGKPTCKDNLCERCDEYYCDDCASHYDQFSQIDYNCCSDCFDSMREY